MTRLLPQFLLQSHGSDLTTWVGVSIGGLGLIYLLLRPRGKKKDPLASTPNFTLSQQRSVERQMETLLVELSNMARQITAQLDTRAAKLELLIKEADDRIAALRAGESAPATSRRAAEIPPVVASPVPASPPPPPVDDRYANVYSLADEGHSLPEIARRLGQPAGEVELILALRPR